MAVWQSTFYGLFDTPREEKRQKLLALGWTHVPLMDASWWRQPDTGVVMVEREAFLCLDAAEAILGDAKAVGKSEA